MNFAFWLNLVHPLVSRLLAAMREHQFMADRAMLEKNATIDILYNLQIPDALVKCVHNGCQIYCVLEYVFAVSVLIT